MVIQGYFVSAVFLTNFIEVDDQHLVVYFHYFVRDRACLVERIAFTQVNGAATKLQGILEGHLDTNVKPAVDAPMQEAQREIIDHAHRDNRQQHEYADHARGQMRTDRFQTVLHDQFVNVINDQAQQGDKADRVKKYEPVIILAEGGCLRSRIADCI